MSDRKLLFDVKIQSFVECLFPSLLDKFEHLHLRRLDPDTVSVQFAALFPPLQFLQRNRDLIDQVKKRFRALAGTMERIPSFIPDASRLLTAVYYIIPATEVQAVYKTFSEKVQGIFQRPIKTVDKQAFIGVK